MAKLIVMAHPFERLSGQVTREKQELVYNDNRNPLWNAPVGKQVALNFKPQMVVSYNSKTQKQSFRIQTHSSADNTEQGRLRMALFGGAIALVSAVKKNPTLLANAYSAYSQLKDHYKSFTSFLTMIIRTMLKNKSAMVNLFSFRINNPWVGGGTGTNVTISAEVLQKFAPYLCPYVIVVDGEIVAYTGNVPGGEETTYAWVYSDNNPFKNADFSAKSYTTPDEEVITALAYKGTICWIEGSSSPYPESPQSPLDESNRLSTIAPNA